MFVAEMIARGFKSISVIGMGKNTGKTFSFNQLLLDAARLEAQIALTSIGLDGEERDSLFYHNKPKITICPGQVVANAKTFILESGLDYEILDTTGIMTPLGEVILAKAQSRGQTMLAGPATRHELILVKERLERFGIDLFFVDGAIDRRSLSAPMVTDATVLAVGAEVSWDRLVLLEKLRLQLQILKLLPWNQPSLEHILRNLATDADVKAVLFSKNKLQMVISQQVFLKDPDPLAKAIDLNTETVFIRGMLTDAVLVKVLAGIAPNKSITILVTDPTCVFLNRQSFQKIEARQGSLRVLDAICISAVTVNPFNSSFGQADPLRLLWDVGQVVYPIPAFDLNLGIRYSPEKGESDAIS